MLRFSTFLLCGLLAAAVAGRYYAEVSVREERKKIREIEMQISDENKRIQVLRVELAWLERPERLVKIAEEKTTLEPVTSGQLVSTHEFLSIIDQQNNLQED